MIEVSARGGWAHGRALLLALLPALLAACIARRPTLSPSDPTIPWRTIQLDGGLALPVGATRAECEARLGEPCEFVTYGSALVGTVDPTTDDGSPDGTPEDTEPTWALPGSTTCVSTELWSWPVSAPRWDLVFVEERLWTVRPIEPGALAFRSGGSIRGRGRADPRKQRPSRRARLRDWRQPIARR